MPVGMKFRKLHIFLEKYLSYLDGDIISNETLISDGDFLFIFEIQYNPNNSFY